MPAVSRDRLNEVVELLWEGVYESSFRGKSRGRFAITRDQLRMALIVDRLHTSTVRALQDLALRKGLIVIDLDDLFPCIETKVVRGYRRPTADLFARLCEKYITPGEDETRFDGDGEEEEDDDA